MITLTEFRAKIRLLLGSDALHYPDALLDESLRQALRQYSAAFPQMHQRDLVLTSGGRAQPLDALAGLQQVMEVSYIDQLRPLPFRLTWMAGMPQLLLGTFTLPAAGDVLRVTYTAGHTISGLDGSTLTTVKAEHSEEFTAGSAAFAVKSRSVSLMESFGTALNPPDALTSWAREAIGQFQYWLEDLKRLEIGIEEFPRGWNWQLDRWDKQAV